MATRSKPQIKKTGKPQAKTVVKKVVKPTAKPDVKLVGNTRDTLAKLRAHVDDIEKRLKRANSLTRTSVKALKTSYKILDGENQTSSLTGHIEKLSNRLTGMIEQTRQDVAHDLKIVLNDPRLETLSGALTKANQRLTSAEQNQAETINAINAHIARLANAVDERMQCEERQREKGDERLSERMAVIEQDSAEAIKTIGDKIVSVSEALSSKAQDLRSELAKQTMARQQDYEEHKHEMARRIEAIEDDQRNQFPSLERSISTLSTRLESLEGTIGISENPAPAIISKLAYETAPHISAEQSAAKLEAAPYTGAQPDDAFAALELVNMQAVPPPSNTYANAQYAQSDTNVMPVNPAVNPVENSQVQQDVYTPVAYTANAGITNGQNPEVFSPRAYTPGNNANSETSALADMPPPVLVTDNGPVAYDPDAYNSDAYNSGAYDQAQAGQDYYEQPINQPENQVPPPHMPTAPMSTAPINGVPPMPGSTPEIQMLEPTMENARPGAYPNAKSGKSKKRKKTKMRKEKSDGGNGHGMIRKIALFGGVAVIALFAYKIIVPKVFGADTSQSRTTQIRSSQANSSESLTRVQSSEIGDLETPSQAQTFKTVEPVGDYSDTLAAPNLGDNTTKGGGQKRTLEAAAADGNPIAQFQLGLSHLEAGRDADAVRLIRLAANQGQPAAQYRLAKLYEAGIGVKVNGKTAKDLLARSANAGNRIAMHDLGHFFATGADGAAPDLRQAVKWFSMAAERGVLDSQFNLAVLYQGGSGIPRSLEDAYVWYAVAGAQGDKIALQRSETVARELSQENLNAARERVKAYAPKPANNIANGVFNNLPWISVQKANAKTRNSLNKSSKINVKTAQRMLRSLGYQVGKPDGVMGPNTRNAIISFERANSMPETGRVNATLLERLQLAAGV